MDKEFNDALKDMNLVKLNESAENAVAIAVLGTVTTGVVPIPFADAPIMISAQVAMMVRICSIYKIGITEDALKMLVAAVLETSGATVIGRTVTGNLFKLIPGVGSAVGAAISGGTAGILTWGIGMAFIEICKLVKSGALTEADLTSKRGRDEFKKRFHEQLASKLAEDES